MFSNKNSRRQSENISYNQVAEYPFADYLNWKLGNLVYGNIPNIIKQEARAALIHSSFQIKNLQTLNQITQSSDEGAKEACLADVKGLRWKFYYLQGTNDKRLVASSQDSRTEKKLSIKIPEDILAPKKPIDLDQYVSKFNNFLEGTFKLPSAFAQFICLYANQGGLFFWLAPLSTTFFKRVVDINKDLNNFAQLSGTSLSFDNQTVEVYTIDPSLNYTNKEMWIITKAWINISSNAVSVFGNDPRNMMCLKTLHRLEISATNQLNITKTSVYLETPAALSLKSQIDLCPELTLRQEYNKKAGTPLNANDPLKVIDDLLTTNPIILQNVYYRFILGLIFDGYDRQQYNPYTRSSVNPNTNIQNIRKPKKRFSIW